MEALLTFSAIVILLVILAALSDRFGVDTRDGFANDWVRSNFS
jgi:hypothetical protein